MSETFSDITQPSGSTGASREESPARWALILLINVHQGLKCGSQSVLNQLQVLTLDMRIKYFLNHVVVMLFHLPLFSYSHFEGSLTGWKALTGDFHTVSGQETNQKMLFDVWFQRRWSTNQTAQAGAWHWCKLQKGKNAALGWTDKNRLLVLSDLKRNPDYEIV